jgi:hypothetical protein
MAFHMGNQGKVNTGAGGADLPTIEWSFTKRNRLAEITNSASAGVAQYKKAVSEYQGTVTFLWDDAAMPETVNIDDGTEVVLQLYYGDSGKKRTVYAIIEEVTDKVNNRQGVVEITANFRGNSSANVTRPNTPA